MYTAPEPTGATNAHPVAVPTFEKSLAARPVTDSLNVTSKMRNAAFVMRSEFETPVSEPAWRAMVATGGVTSRVTVLSVEVDGSLGLPAASATTPAPIVAMTVPEPVIPLTVTVYVVGPPVTVAVVAPAVPDRVTSPPTKPMTVSLKTTVNLMVAPLVGSTWAAAWSMVTVGGVASQVTVLSVEVEAVFRLPRPSVATPAAIVAITVPGVVIPLTATVYVVGPPLTVPVFTPPDVPPIVTSPVAKPMVGSLKTTV